MRKVAKNGNRNLTFTFLQLLNDCKLIIVVHFFVISTSKIKISKQEISRYLG